MPQLNEPTGDVQDEQRWQEMEVEILLASLEARRAWAEKTIRLLAARVAHCEVCARPQTQEETP